MFVCYSGGRQCPGDMLLILSRGWMSHKKYDLRDGLYSLYVHKAVTFESGGRSYLDQFDPPRKVTYFMNFSHHDAQRERSCDDADCEVGNRYTVNCSDHFDLKFN